MKFSRMALAIGLILVALIALAAQTAAMAEDAHKRTMTLTGTGIVFVTPDKAVITIGVQTRDKAAGTALAKNNTAMRSVMDVLAAQGLAPADIQTSTFSITPQTVYPGNDRTQPPKVVGYVVSNEVRATVRQLDTLGTVLDKAIGAGSNQINNIRFAVTNPEPHNDEARRLATRDAMRKAKLFAEEAGVELGIISAIAETNTGRVTAYAREASFAADAAVPIAAGQQSLQMQVVITWALKD